MKSEIQITHHKSRSGRELENDHFLVEKMSNRKQQKKSIRGKIWNLSLIQI